LRYGLSIRPNQGSKRMTISAYDAALALLPKAYAIALRLTDAAAPAEEICKQLGIEPESLDALLEVARRKLRTARSQTT
jgi:DNA-directed RNA polymerase specialized sigma24 family protein